MKKFNKWVLIAGVTAAPFAMMAGPHHPEPHRGDAVVNLVGNCIGLVAEVLRIGTPEVVVTPVCAGVAYVGPAYYAPPAPVVVHTAPPPPHHKHAPAPPHKGGHDRGGHNDHGGRNGHDGHGAPRR